MLALSTSVYVCDILIGHWLLSFSGLGKVVGSVDEVVKAGMVSEAEEEKLCGGVKYMFQLCHDGRTVPSIPGDNGTL